MPAERYFIDTELLPDQEVTLEDAEFHHFANVMRGKVGHQVELVNGLGSLAEATAIRVEKKKAIVSIETVSFAPEEAHDLILAQAYPRFHRLDFIVEKGTELGMKELWLFPGERSERKELSESQLERLNGVTIAALKQCGRLHLPKIIVKPPLVRWTEPDGNLYFGDVNPTAPLLYNQLTDSPAEAKKKIVFCTGPESGFSDNEENALKAVGAIGVKLHGNILRTDTASITALAIISHILSSTL